MVLHLGVQQNEAQKKGQSTYRCQRSHADVVDHYVTLALRRDADVTIQATFNGQVTIFDDQTGPGRSQYTGVIIFV